jgi:hypothetical protein
MMSPKRLTFTLGAGRVKMNEWKRYPMKMENKGERVILFTLDKTEFK